MSNNEIKNTAKTIEKTLLLLAIALSTVFWVFVFYSPYTLVEGEKGIRIADYSGYNLSTVAVNYDTDASVSVQILETDSEYVFYAKWRHLFSQFTSPEDNNTTPDIIITEILADGNTSLIISVSSTVENWRMENMSPIDIWEFYIYINPIFITNFTANFDTGSIDILARNTVFGTLSITQNTGDTDLTLENCTILGNLNSVSDTGSVYLAATSVAISGGVSIGVSTGDISLAFQSVAINSVLQITDDTGSVEFAATQVAISGGLSIGVSTGDIDLAFQTVAINSSIIITDDTGSIEAAISGLTLGCDWAMATNTGDVDIAMDSLTILGARVINLSADTGTISMGWNQGTLLGAPMTINAVTGTGDINIYIDTVDPAEIIVNTSTDTGSEDVQVV